MPSQTKENYLKALYYLHYNGDKITVTNLGQKIGASKPTVSDMIKKLEGMGWVKHEKYQPIAITKKGLLAATQVVRKHRLSEMFLSQVMGFGWEQVHDTAEELEHVKSDLFFDRMDEILGFPTRDPHGSIIPDKEGKLSNNEYLLLSQVSSGQTVLFKAIRDSSVEFLQFLNKKKLTLNTKIMIHSLETFDNSMVVSYGEENNLVLSEQVCQRILIETT